MNMTCVESDCKKTIEINSLSSKIGCTIFAFSEISSYAIIVRVGEYLVIKLLLHQLHYGMKLS